MYTNCVATCVFHFVLHTCMCLVKYNTPCVISTQPFWITSLGVKVEQLKIYNVLVFFKTTEMSVYLLAYSKYLWFCFDRGKINIIAGSLLLFKKKKKQCVGYEGEVSPCQKQSSEMGSPDFQPLNITQDFIFSKQANAQILPKMSCSGKLL